jgi:hypothetical protein
MSAAHRRKPHAALAAQGLPIDHAGERIDSENTSALLQQYVRRRFCLAPRLAQLIAELAFAVVPL